MQLKPRLLRVISCLFAQLFSSISRVCGLLRLNCRIRFKVVGLYKLTPLVGQVSKEPNFLYALAINRSLYFRARVRAQLLCSALTMLPKLLRLSAKL